MVLTGIVLEEHGRGMGPSLGEPSFFRVTKILPRDGLTSKRSRYYSDKGKPVKTKMIFITGGVLSSLGKGVAAAAIGALLEARGLRVTFQKLDPYINVDPGTMNPFQHGEVFVTEDGAETDLDLGHYERFTTVTLGQDHNFTSGRIYYQRHHQGAPGGLSRGHGPGHPPHHRRNQAGHPVR